MRNHSKIIIHIGFVANCLFLVWIGVRIYQNQRVASETNKQVFYSSQIIFFMEKVLQFLNQAENQQQKYLISDKATHLQAYYQYIDSLGTYLDTLVTITRQDNYQRIRIDSLKKNASVKIDLMQYSILLKKNNNTAGLQMLYASDQNNRTLNYLQQVLQDVIQEERQQLAIYTSIYTAAIGHTMRYVYWVLGTYVLLLLIGFVLIRNKYKSKAYYENRLVALQVELKWKREELTLNTREHLANSKELTTIYSQLNTIKNEFANMSLARIAKIRRINNRLMAEARKREKITENLRKSEARFRTALNKAPIVVFNQDCNLVYTWIYDTSDSSRHPFAQLLGKTDQESFSETEALSMTHIKQHVLASGEGIAQEILITLNKKKMYYWLTIEPLFDKNHQICGITCAAYDITQQKKAEDALQHTLKELKKRNHELDNYVYKVSHDLRAPLVSILGLLSLIKEDFRLENIAQYLLLIENRVNKMDDFIKSVLSHSRSINSEIIIKKIDFGKIIDACREEFRYLPNMEKVEIRLEHGKDAEFFNDEEQVSIILKNIISNAIKYQNPNILQQYLQFHISIREQYVLIVVEDNGIGIEEQYLPRVFDMFFKGTAKSDGSGLGLYIVKQTIERLEGSITVESEFGTGTTLRILLPNLAMFQNDR